MIKSSTDKEVMRSTHHFLKDGSYKHNPPKNIYLSCSSEKEVHDFLRKQRGNAHL